MKNREIKFRVWEPRHRIMQYPDVLQIADGKHDKSWGQEYKFTSDSEPDAVLMQFTGLLDKNGKEIYEGDIVIVQLVGGKAKAKIIWDKGAFRIDTPEVIAYYPFGEMQTEESEVIGNIYENPGESRINIMKTNKYKKPSYERNQCPNCGYRFQKSVTKNQLKRDKKTILKGWSVNNKL